MISLYLRIAAYAAAIVLCVGGGGYLNGLRWQAKYDALVSRDAQATAQALAAADAANQAQVDAYESKLVEIQDAHQKDLAAAHSAADALAASLHDYADRRCPDPVPARTGPAGGADAAPAKPPGDAAITAAARSILETCAADASRLSALQAERRSLSDAAKPY